MLEVEQGCSPAGSWIRSSYMSLQKLFSNEDSTIFVKTGHLIEWPNQAITYLVSEGV